MSSNTVSGSSLLFYTRQEQQPTPAPGLQAGISSRSDPVLFLFRLQTVPSRAVVKPWAGNECAQVRKQNIQGCVWTLGGTCRQWWHKLPQGQPGWQGMVPARPWRRRHECLTNRSTLGSSCCHPRARLCRGDALCPRAPHKSVGIGAITSLPFPWPNATPLALGDSEGCWSTIHTTHFHIPGSFTCAIWQSASTSAELDSQVNKVVLDVIYSCIYFCPSMSYKCKKKFLINTHRVENSF